MQKDNEFQLQNLTLQLRVANQSASNALFKLNEHRNAKLKPACDQDENW